MPSQLQTNLTYTCGLIEDHAEEYPNFYDVIVSSEVLEHVIDKTSFLRGCVKCLKPGGSLFLTTINKTFNAWFIMKLVGEYLFRILPKRTHAYNQFVSPEELKSILGEFNCDVKNETGFYYWFWNKKFYLRNSMDCMFGLHAVKNCNGIK